MKSNKVSYKRGLETAPDPEPQERINMDKSSTTLLMLLASSSAVLTLFVCIGIYISNQPQLHSIWVYFSSHPILALNLLILLIIFSSRFFAISRNNNSIDYRGDRDQLLLPSDSPQSIIPLSPNSEGMIY